MRGISTTQLISPGKNLNRAKRESWTLFRRKQLLPKYHTSSLDAILTNNGLKRIRIEGNGDCFFTSIQKSCKLKEDICEIRGKICDHMDENVNEYIYFLPRDSEEQMENLRADKFKTQLQNLRQTGIWSTDLGDVLPLATANTLQIEILIYTSRRNNHIIQIQPSLASIKDKVTLAYLATKGFEHYDICKAIGKQSNSPNKGDVQTETEKHRTPKDKIIPKRKNQDNFIDITPRKRAKYASPRRKDRTRKRKSNPEAWKRNVRKNPLQINVANVHHIMQHQLRNT